MPSEIQIFHADKSYQVDSFDFPGGEVQVQVPGLPDALIGPVTVLARLQSPVSILRLLLACEILSRVHVGRKTLVVPYFPYARQDRVMRPWEAFSLKPVCRLVNSLGFDEVVTLDPHSDVTAALVEHVRIISQVDLVLAHSELSAFIGSELPVVVAPDAGAAKKALAIAKQFSRNLITASKVRDVRTGEITSTHLDASMATGEWTALIVDDICDGGRTFVELAKALRERGAKRVALYITHGIFSKGLGVFDGLIDEVFATDSFLSRDVESPHQSPVPLHVSPIHF